MSNQKLRQQMIGVTLVMLLLAGCGAPAATPVPPTATPVPPTPTPIPPTPTTIPTETKVPTPTTVPSKPPALSQEELLQKWQPPIAASTLVFAACEGVLETAEKRQADEIDGFEAFGELLGSGIVLAAVEEGIAEWIPPYELLNFKQMLQEHIDSIQDVVGQWLDDEVTSADIPDLLSEQCEMSYATMEEILEASYSDGLTETEIDAIVTEMQASLEEAASQLEQEVTSQEPSAPQEPGFRRGNPIPRSEIVPAPNWDVQVLEVVQGDEAWQAIQAANEFNEPAPEGTEYLLVKLHVKCTYADNEEHSISGYDFKVTGDRLIKYSTASVVEPEPALNAQLFTDGEAEGWSAYLIDQGENNLILIVDELMNWDHDRFRYAALDEGASITVPTELGDIKPTDSGKERSSPAPFGETITTEDWQVTITEAVRGNDAWTMVQDANQFNDPPEEGMEYIALKVRVRYISTVDQATQIDAYYFGTTGSANVMYDLPSVVDPSPPLDVTLFPGGEYEGWAVVQAAKGETGIMAVFEPLFDFSNRNRRFLSLEP